VFSCCCSYFFVVVINLVFPPPILCRFGSEELGDMHLWARPVPWVHLVRACIETIVGGPNPHGGIGCTVPSVELGSIFIKIKPP
jgi:hypothetical protein